MALRPAGMPQLRPPASAFTTREAWVLGRAEPCAVPSTRNHCRIHITTFTRTFIVRWQLHPQQWPLDTCGTQGVQRGNMIN